MVLRLNFWWTTQAVLNGVVRLRIYGTSSLTFYHDQGRWEELTVRDVLQLSSSARGPSLNWIT
jgi:hypothetical protein